MNLSEIKFTTNRKLLAGILFLLGWCIVSAIARIITANSVHLYDPYIICFNIFLITTLFYLIFCLSEWKEYIFIIKKNYFNIFMLNFSSFGSWFFLIYPMTIIQPSVVSTISLGIGPLSGILLSTLILKSNITPQIEKIFIFIITIFIFLLCMLCLFQKSGILLSTATHTQIIRALLSCFICGFFTNVNNLFAKKLANKHVKPKQILALRFWLIAIISPILAIFFSPKWNTYTFSEFFIMLKLATLLIIIPLYFAQQAIQYLSSSVISMIAPLMPILLTLFQWEQNIILPYQVLILMACIVLCLLLYFFKFFSGKHKCN